MATLKHSLRSYFKTPFVTVYNGFFSLEKNFLCFSKENETGMAFFLPA